jgi:hypothetical protein
MLGKHVMNVEPFVFTDLADVNLHRFGRFSERNAEPTSSPVPRITLAYRRKNRTEQKESIIEEERFLSTRRTFNGGAACPIRFLAPGGRKLGILWNF